MAARNEMTERKWLRGENYKPMLCYLEGKVSDRKLRLFAAAGAWQVRHLMRSERSLAALEAAERFADGLACVEELETASQQAEPLDVSPPAEHGEPAYQAAWAAHCASWPSPGESASWTAASVEQAMSYAAGEIPWGDGKAPAERRQRAILCVLLREVVGNPFRGVPVAPGWLGPTVASLAESAYRMRSATSGEMEGDRLAVLADALEEAGCADEAVLSHLRCPGPHVRGCWALDLALGLK
jgi:hypothetical protein